MGLVARFRRKEKTRYTVYLRGRELTVLDGTAHAVWSDLLFAHDRDAADRSLALGKIRRVTPWREYWAAGGLIAEAEDR